MSKELNRTALFVSLSQRDRDVFEELRSRMKITTMTGMLRRLVEEEAGRNKWTDLVAILQDERVRRAETLRLKGRVNGLKSGVVRRAKRDHPTG